MRTAILIIVAFLLPVLAFSQSKSSQRLFLKDGTAIGGSIEIQDDGAYKITTPAGDVFYFLPSEIEYVSGFLQEGNFTDGNNPVIRRGNKLCYSGNKVELKHFDFDSLESWNKYMEVQKKGKRGRIFLYSGIGGLVVGGVTTVFTVMEGLEVIPYISYGVAVIGLGFGIAGLVMTINSNKKMSKIANEFNPNPGYALNFGIQQHGIGLSLAF